jgi:hypothetical protein
VWFSVPLGRQFLREQKAHIWQLDGAGWIRDDAAEKPILEYLRQQPRSIVLQRMEAESFTPAPSLTLHAGHQVFLGWPGHENLWRANRTDIDQRKDQLNAFYRGELQDAASWLLENEIEHVLWLKTEGRMPAGAWERIDEAIRLQYVWREHYRAGDFRVGLWSRRKFTFHSVPSVPGGSETGAPSL